MLLSAQDGFGADRIRELLASRVRELTWGVDLLDMDGVFVRPLLTVGEYTVQWNGYADVHRQVDLTIAEELDWMHVRVRPFFALSGARFPLGVFGLARPENPASGVYRVHGTDKMTVLQRIIGDTYVVAPSEPGAPTFYTTAVRQLIADAGISGTTAIQSDADAVECADGLFWVLDPQAPDTYLRAANDALAMIAYRGLWMDSEGVPTSVPYVAPTSRAAEWVFDCDDVASNVVFPDPSVVIDNWVSTTAWRMLRNGVVGPAEGSGMYTVGDWDAAGAIRALFTVDAASQGSLVSQGDQQVRTDSAATKLVNFSCAAMPFDHFDVARFRSKALALDAKAQVRQWKAMFPAGRCDVTAEVVDGG